ncbi:hypothetical protein Poly21_05230 [Allorhodopirellula heiligendammensis]|uniref:DUF4350 domain-containing protein n=2 Tax=Allorhodopirellula heiligendammensis TaxID=2714739 RepID=A0A5C6C428_9BACT|nr:hypothetical protein Poly21_05230 [Allorhodopirellula heiligendammensis]
MTALGATPAVWLSRYPLSRACSTRVSHRSVVGMDHETLSSADGFHLIRSRSAWRPKEFLRGRGRKLAIVFNLAKSSSVVGSLLLFVLLCSGCSRFSTEYGASDGVPGDESLNGFGAFRTALEGAPAGLVPELEIHDVARLSDRESESDAIVWLPTRWPPSNPQEVQEWLDRWLAQDHRTLIFVVPDSGSTEAYFREASATAPADQRLSYRRRLAQLINERLLAEANRSDIGLGDWFTARALPYRVELPGRRLVDFSVEQSTAQPPAASNSTDPLHFEVVEQEAADAATGSRSLTTLARITRDRWKSSQVLVVSSGSLLTNFAMTAPAARELTRDLQNAIRRISETDPATPITVGFLSSRYTAIPISAAQPGLPKARGWELMTEMPLSLINLHVAFLGIVLCLMLLPVFGRPRSVRYNQPTHFGNHLSAMAALMRRSGGTVYAKQKISAYLRLVRGETSGPWVLPQEDAVDSEHPNETETR